MKFVLILLLFRSESKLKDSVQKYSQFIQYPIYVKVKKEIEVEDDEDDDDEEEEKDEEEDVR